MTDDTTSMGEGTEGRLSEAALRTIFHSVNDAIIVHDAETGAIIDVNETMCGMYGYSREKARQLTVEELNSGEPPCTEQEAIENMQKAACGESQIYEWHAKKSDGELFWVEMSMRRAYVGDELRVLAIAREITERKRREEELEALTTRLELALEETGTGVWEWDLRTDELIWDETSKCLFGYGPGEFPNRFAGFADRLPDEDLTCVEQAVEEAIDTHTECEVEFRVDLPDGTQRWLQACGITEYDADGKPVRMVGVQTDVTERVVAAQLVEQQRDGLELLNSVVRHDIRNDLQLIDAYTEMLAETDHNDRYLSVIRRATTNAVDLTTTARELSEVMLQPDFEPEPIDLKPVLQAEIDAVRQSYTEAKITVKGAIPDVLVLADELLAAVFRNLIKNAVQHNRGETPGVWVSVDCFDGLVEIRVADDGPGVDDAHSETIFGKGSQGLDSDGTGIGLYLVQSLVDGYGGDVWVEDRERPNSITDRPRTDNNDPTGAVFVVQLTRVE